MANPGKLVAAPVNYEKHLAEVKSDASLHQNTASHTLTIHKAGVFLKATSSLVGRAKASCCGCPDRRTDHEVELAFVIGRTASRVPRAEALRYVAGYAIGLDISIRGTEDKSFRKSADTYSVLGPWLVTADEIADPGALDLELRVNGERRQHSNTREMTLGVAELIEMASSFYTLHPGDVVFTGTPEGVSPIEPGDEIVATIQGIGIDARGGPGRRGGRWPAAGDCGASAHVVTRGDTGRSSGGPMRRHARSYLVGSCLVLLALAAVKGAGQSARPAGVSRSRSRVQRPHGERPAWRSRSRASRPTGPSSPGSSTSARRACPRPVRQTAEAFLKSLSTPRSAPRRCLPSITPSGGSGPTSTATFARASRSRR